ncbi:hypothetical protein Pfo_030958 [Paulownia fortunei]|nr:hypothetical protein Pfo_030958 [Paulownia fortunei]
MQSKVDEITEDSWKKEIFPEWGSWLNEEIEQTHVEKAAILNGVEEKVPFIGPKYVVDQWIAWGVPQDRCIIVKPGDTLKIKDVQILVTDSFDRSILITDPDTDQAGIPADNQVPEMDKRSVNYVVKTTAGTVYDAADSHYSAYFAKHGQEFNIDVATVAYGENPIGVQDKMTSVDVLRTAEALQTKVIIPLHWDIWSNMLGDPYEIELLWKYRKEKLQYQFNPMMWLPGGKFTYPDDIGKLQYYHPRGFNDRYTNNRGVCGKIMKLQVAIDRVSLTKAIQLSKQLDGLVDIVELGTSIVKDYGLEALKDRRFRLKQSELLVDLKTIDEGEYEFKKGFETSADILTVMGNASRGTLEQNL